MITLKIFLNFKETTNRRKKTKDSLFKRKGNLRRPFQSTSTIKDLTLSNLRLFLFLELVAVEKLESGKLGP
jgi:hypothetical protein